MIFLFDEYTDNTKKLQETMECLGVDAKIVVMEDDGFLPKGILSPYEYYVSRQNHEKHAEEELFYNFLKVPEFWEIRSMGTTGGIYDMGSKKATIYFAEPVEKRIVKRVEWHMEDEWVYEVDYYNRCGLKYASEFRDINGCVESKVFYSDRNQEVVVEQPGNNVITLLENGTTRAFFTSYAEFIKYYMDELNTGEKQVLFVQNEKQFEYLDLGTDENNMWGCTLFLNDGLLDKYMAMGGKKGYKFYGMSKCHPENKAKGEALILTASDNIEQIENLVCELPGVVFHIAANTQVSDKLYKLAERENVEVYPGIGEKDLKALWSKCDFYLDINHYREIYNAVDEAYYNNLLIMGFENTVHHREMLVKGCVFAKQDYKKMALVMKYLINNVVLMQKLLLVQQKKRREIWQKVFDMTEETGE